MRKLDLSLGVDFPNGRYTLKNLLCEFVFAQDWSQDEGSVAAFDRLSAAVQGDGKIEEKDFTTLCNRLKNVQLPAAVSIELGHLRNEVVLKTPKED